MSMSVSTRIIGLGNEYRSDDGVGPAVVRQLQAQQELHRRGIDIVCCDDETHLLDLWQNARHVIMIDAASFSATAGTIMRLNLLTQPLPVPFEAISTHTIGLRAVLGIARVVQSLPHSLILYAIEGKNYVSGISLSSEVARAANEVTWRVQTELQ